MLKFSGFADLTSCLQRYEPYCIKGSLLESTSTQDIKDAYKVACHKKPPWIGARQRQRDTLTHKHTHTTLPQGGGVVGISEWTLKQACFQGYPESAVYVQVPIGSRNPAIHNAYHTLLCPSSLFEPRHRSLKVVRRKWRTT